MIDTGWSLNFLAAVEQIISYFKSTVTFCFVFVHKFSMGAGVSCLVSNIILLALLT